MTFCLIRKAPPALRRAATVQAAKMAQWRTEAVRQRTILSEVGARPRHLGDSMTAPNADLVQQHLGDAGIAQLTQHLGVDSGTAKAAAAAALPMLVQAMANRSSAGGGSALSGAGGLGGLAGGLGSLFGGNHADAAQQVSHKTGLNMQDAEKALLFLAPIVLARFSQQRQQPAPAPTTTNAAGAAAAPSPVGAPPAESDSALGKVIGAVEKIFHR
jgi:uncharacterized protein YidB (DUF937 family)